MSAIVLASLLDGLGSFLQPSTLLNVLVEGLAKAALFVMIASGLSLIFGLMGVLNFAHGSLTMIGAYVGGLVVVTFVSDAAGVGARVALFLVAALLVFGLLSVAGSAIEVGLIRPLYDRPIYQILLTFGLTLILDEGMRIVLLFYDMQPISEWQEALATKPAVLSQSHDLTAPVVLDLSALGLWRIPLVSPLELAVGVLAAAAAWVALARTEYGSNVRSRIEQGEAVDALLEHDVTGALSAGRAAALALAAGTVVAGVVGVLGWRGLTALVGLETVSVRGLALFEIAFGVVVVAVIWGFLTRTRYGLIIRAGSEDPEMTEALGIDVRRAFTVVFGLGVGLAGVAGALLMWDPRWGASVPLATETLLPAFVVVIVGGLGTFRGTVAAGLLVGVVDATMTWWFQNVVDFPGLPELMIFLILVVVLIVRPQGLFGVAEVGGH